MDRRFFHLLGASLLDRTICSTAGAVGMRMTVGANIGADAEGFPRATDAALGHEHAHVESAPLAVRARGARARRARSSRIDPLRTRTAEQCDEWIADPARHRRRARARDDARALRARHSRTATISSATRSARTELRARAREYPPERVRRDHRHSRRAHRRRSRASTAARRRRSSASTTDCSATPAAAWRCARSPACRRSPGTGAAPAAACSSRRARNFQFNHRALERPDLSPPGAHDQHDPARRGADACPMRASAARR